MRSSIHHWNVFVAVVFAIAAPGVASAAPAKRAPPPTRPTAAATGDAKALLETAKQAANSGQHDKALAAIEDGLKVVAGDTAVLQQLLKLKGQELSAVHDFDAAYDAFEAYLGTTPPPPPGPKREFEGFVKRLAPVKTTFLEVTVTNGPADVYLNARSFRQICQKAKPCGRVGVLPNSYKVIVERDGFVTSTSPVTVAAGATAKLAVTLVEKPSQLTVRVTPPDAKVAVDDADYPAALAVPAGPHKVVVTLAGHATARLEAVAHEGKPVALDVTLDPLVPTRVEPASAELRLDDKPIGLLEGGLVIPPGDHRLVARASGFDERTVAIPAERGADYQIAIELAVKKAVVVQPPPPGLSPRRKLALAAGGAGVVALAGGVVLGLQSRSADHDAYALCPSPATPCASAQEANDLNQRGRWRATQANIAFGFAGAAVVTAAVLWLTGAPESRVAVSAQLGNVSGVDVAVRF